MLYTASKHAVLGIVRAAARDLGPQGVRVNALAPGPIATEALLDRIHHRARTGGADANTALQELAHGNSLGRLATAAEVAQAAEARLREARAALRAARDTEAEARDTLREIVAKADSEAVEGFGAAVKQAGQSSADGKGMWADSSFEDLVQYNDGFRTQLIGTPEQIAERIVKYKALGVDLILAGFLHYHEEVEYFGSRVLPIVRELEADLPAREPVSV